MNLYSEITKRIINMIEKKISYNINIEKPSTTKPVKQGGVLNYLGKQKTVNAPVKWRSSKDHPIAHLSYITKDEEKILIDLNLYGSLKGKPNRGPFGLPSLQGSGGGSEGAGSDSSGTGASEGTAQGPGPNEGAEAGQAAANAAEAAADAAAAAAQNSFSPDIGGIVGPGPGQQDVTGFGTDYSDADMGPVGPNAQAGVDMSTPALQTMQEKAMAQARNTFSPAGIFGGVLGMMTGIPGGFGIGSTIGSNMARGVTAPGTEQFDQDYAKMDLTTDVRNIGPETNTSGGGGITTIQSYAPLSNKSTGDNTADSIRKRLEDLLKGPPVLKIPTGEMPQQPTSYEIPAANQLSNYNLLDLVNLRR
jgi:hypothetical protein